MPGTSKIFAVLYSTFSTVYDSGVMVICMLDNDMCALRDECILERYFSECTYTL